MTTGERLVTLSELLTVETAMTHFLAIDTSGTGGGLVVVGELDVELEGRIVAQLSDAGITAVIEAGLEVDLEEDFDVDIEDDGITGRTC